MYLFKAKCLRWCWIGKENIRFICSFHQYGVAKQDAYGCRFTRTATENLDFNNFSTLEFGLYFLNFYTAVHGKKVRHFVSDDYGSILLPRHKNKNGSESCFNR